MAEIDENRSSWFSRLAFLALVASLGFIQTPITILGQNLVITDIIFLFLAVSWLIDIALRGGRPRWQTFYWVLLFYIGGLVLSCIFSAEPRQSFSRLPAEIYLPVLTVIAADLARTSTGLRSSILAWLLGCAFAVLLGVVTIGLFYTAPGNVILDHLTYHYGAVPVGNYPRITSTFVSASMFCNYLNVSLLFTVVAAVAGWISKRFAWLLGGGILICSLFTFSAGLGGIFLGLGIVCFLLTYWTSSLRSSVLAASVLIALGFLFLSVVSLTRDQNGADQCRGLTLSPSGRILVWQEAFQTFEDNFLTGHGIDLPVANVQFRNAEGGYSLLTDAHDTYLSVAAQAGIVGLVAIVAITIYFLIKWKAAVKARKTVVIGLGAAFLCAFVYQGLTGSFEHARHLWVLMGLFIGAERIESEPNQNS